MGKGKLNINLLKGVEAEENAIKIDQETEEMAQTYFSHEESQNAPQTTQNAEIDTKTKKARKSTPKLKKAIEKANTRQEKQVFSFRASKYDVQNWKAYSTATERKMSDVLTAAMNEYMKRHKLSGAEEAVFVALKAKNEK